MTIDKSDGKSRIDQSGESFCNALALKSGMLASLLAKNDVPPLWPRKPGFESLVHIILEQAVSLESAKAVYEKCQTEIGKISPELLLVANEQVMVTAGFSRMKWKTCRICAESVLNGNINLFPVNQEECDVLADQLINLSGIGPWTVYIYLLLVLQQPDIWPVADRALAVSVSQVFGLKEILNRAALMQMAEPWRPFRSWAARIFWHDYLIQRNRQVA